MESVHGAQPFFVACFAKNSCELRFLFPLFQNKEKNKKHANCVPKVFVNAAVFCFLHLK